MDKGLKTRVLLVDDEQEFLLTLAERLKTRNLTVSTATGGEEAIKLADEQEFDAILLDLAMPGIDGLETLERIKAKHPEAEIIMLTGHGSVEAGVQAIKLGAEDFLEKPVDIHELMDKIMDAREKRVLVLQKQSKEAINKILRSKGW